MPKSGNPSLFAPQPPGEVKYGNGVNCECCNGLYYRQFLLKIAACHTEGSLSVAAIRCGTSCVSALSRVNRVRKNSPSSEAGLREGDLITSVDNEPFASGRHQPQELSSAMLAMREVRAIYHQGVYAVAATIRQLYEMIEVEDERVQKLVAAATAAHLHKIEHLMGRIARLEEELASKVRHAHQLKLTVKGLNKELKRGSQADAAGSGGAPRSSAEGLAELFHAAFSRQAQAYA